MPVTIMGFNFPLVVANLLHGVGLLVAPLASAGRRTQGEPYRASDFQFDWTVLSLVPVFDGVTKNSIPDCGSEAAP